jgi:hypothetical protein
MPDCHLSKLLAIWAFKKAYGAPELQRTQDRQQDRRRSQAPMNNSTDTAKK